MNKAVEDAVQAMIEAAGEIKRLTGENQELLKETFELAGRNDKLLLALKELLRVDDDWHGSVNSEMSAARGLARLAIKEAE